ncbi:MAG: endonuclease/exonuclease/phosphatase family protein [Caldilineaceae bacterium]
MQTIAIAAVTEQSTAHMPLRVMSWNAFFLNKQPAAFRQTVAELQPDLIAIQELGHKLADDIAVNLRASYPYMQLFPTGTPAGMALLSRYPIVTTTPPDFAEATGCNCQLAVVDVAGRQITIINTHPWPPEADYSDGIPWSKMLTMDTSNQDLIFDQLLAQIDQTASPLLVMGDLNTMPFQANVQRLTNRLTDTFDEVGSGIGNTFPLDGTAYHLPSIPLIRIDYIFHDAAWQAQSAWVGDIAGSDHRYVVADLMLTAAN